MTETEKTEPKPVEQPIKAQTYVAVTEPETHDNTDELDIESKDNEVDDEDQPTERRRNRRRRSRRNRRTGDTAVTVESENASDEAVMDVEVETKEASLFIAHETPRFDATVLEDAQDAAKATETAPAEDAVINAEPTPEPINTPSPVETVQILTEPAPTAAPMVETVSVEQLQSNLAHTGLELVQTNSSAATSQSPAVDTPRGRNPRSRWAEPVVHEALVQVETGDEPLQLPALPETAAPLATISETQISERPAVSVEPDASALAVETEAEADTVITTVEAETVAASVESSNEAPAPVVVSTPAFVFDPSHLQDSLSNAGLELIQTDASKVKAIESVAPQLGRARKVVARVEAEPLQLVETKK